MFPSGGDSTSSTGSATGVAAGTYDNPGNWRNPSTEPRTLTVTGSG